MSDEPSPRPWRITHPGEIEDANGNLLYNLRDCIGGGVDEANAALIVAAVNEREHLRDLLWRLTEYADAVTGRRPRTIEVLSSEHPAWTFDGAALLREARAAIGEGTGT